ncbi:hypothetical protein NHH03_16450 [Stieleria sp. TO1_6]|uniref:hypothetical protein n=1 Tax=Stieleria tagensis TaxID=2956795 RepID=UPI00209B8D60|nr:hypothetical protein [Stieleria tagensis]MCO8123342.1 hypothetical protein [Stieleria tagensis]
MKRFLAIALTSGLFSATGTATTTAADYFHGGHHGFGGSHHGSYHHGGFSHAPIQTYPNYGYRSKNSGYGYGQTYQPQYQQQYTPAYRAPSSRQHGGLHIDIGRFHVLGVGGHHH